MTTRSRTQDDVVNWLSTARSLSTKESSIESSIVSLCNRPNSSLSNELRIINTIRHKQEQCRITEQSHMMKQVCGISKQLQKIIDFTSRVNGEEKQLQKLKAMMDTIDEDIIDVKQCAGDKFENLTQESKDIERDIDISLHIIDGVVSHMHKNSKTKTHNDSESSRRTVGLCERHDLLSQASNIQNMIDDEGGVCGGWDEIEHERFRKLRAIYHNEDEFIGRCVRDLPGISIDVVREHNEWFKRYLAYVQRKKELVVEWRQHKQKQNEEEMRRAAHDAELEIAASNASLEDNIEKRQIKAEQIRQWKAEKQASKENAAQARRLRTQQIEQARQQKMQRRQASLEATLLEQHKQKKLLAHLAKMKENNLKPVLPSKLSADQIQKLRQRSENMLERKKNRMKMKSEENMNREHSLLVLAKKCAPIMEAKRDPQRLMGETKSQSIRRKQLLDDNQRHQKEAKGPKRVLDAVQHVPRSVPSWRADL